MMALTGRDTTRYHAGAGGAGGDHTHVGRPVLDSPSDYLLAALLVLVAVGTLGTWLAGQTAALITGGGWPHLAPTAGFTALVHLPRHLSDPAAAWPATVRTQLPGPAGFAVATVLDLTAVLALVLVVARRWGRRTRHRGLAAPGEVADRFSPEAVNAALSRLHTPAAVYDASVIDAPVGELGAATGASQRQIERTARATTARGLPRGLTHHRMGRTSRPDVDAASVDAGHTDPTAHGTAKPVRIGIENSVLVLAAPRQGKTSQVVIPWVTSWPGPALVTSIRPDVVYATAALRPGTSLVMDLTGTTWPGELAWSPLSGCERFDTARRRADLLVTVGKTTNPGASDSTNSAFFGTSATNLLAGWLHAAALSGKTLRHVLTWAMNQRDQEPVAILRDHNGAADGVAPMMDTLYRSPEETLSSLFATVLTGITPLLSETAQKVFCPTGDGFDPGRFLDSGQTIYLIVPDTQARDLAPLISSFVDDIIAAATTRAARAPRGRLNPPLGLFLDEVANVAPLPDLPQLMSSSAGSGIFVTAVLQDIAQARARWGRDGAEMLWGAATFKVILGGLTGDEPAMISKLAGTYRETLTSTTRTPHGAHLSSTLTDRPVLPPETIRTLDPGLRQALILHATTPPVITRMVRHYEGPRAGDHTASEQALRASNTTITGPEPAREG
jgi:type IV secretory pathway TraG/TraD family ATPase VirD4